MASSPPSTPTKDTTSQPSTAAAALALLSPQTTANPYSTTVDSPMLGPMNPAPRPGTFSAPGALDTTSEARDDDTITLDGPPRLKEIVEAWNESEEDERRKLRNMRRRTQYDIANIVYAVDALGGISEVRSQSDSRGNARDSGWATVFFQTYNAYDLYYNRRETFDKNLNRYVRCMKNFTNKYLGAYLEQREIQMHERGTVTPAPAPTRGLPAGVADAVQLTPLEALATATLPGLPDDGFKTSPRRGLLDLCAAWKRIATTWAAQRVPGADMLLAAFARVEAILADDTREPVPIHVLGRTGAGKSFLLNALLRATQWPVQSYERSMDCQEAHNLARKLLGLEDKAETDDADDDNDNDEDGRIKLIQPGEDGRQPFGADGRHHDAKLLDEDWDASRRYRKAHTEGKNDKDTFPAFLVASHNEGTSATTFVPARVRFGHKFAGVVQMRSLAAVKAELEGVPWSFYVTKSTMRRKLKMDPRDQAFFESMLFLRDRLKDFDSTKTKRTLVKEFLREWKANDGWKAHGGKPPIEVCDKAAEALDKVYVVTGQGKHARSDRLFVSQEMNRLVLQCTPDAKDGTSSKPNNHAMFVERSYFFVPSSLLHHENLELVDLPGSEDTNPLRRRILFEALDDAKYLICMVNRGLETNGTTEQLLENRMKRYWAKSDSTSAATTSAAAAASSGATGGAGAGAGAGGPDSHSDNDASNDDDAMLDEGFHLAIVRHDERHQFRRSKMLAGIDDESNLEGLRNDVYEMVRDILDDVHGGNDAQVMAAARHWTEQTTVTACRPLALASMLMGPRPPTMSAADFESALEHTGYPQLRAFCGLASRARYGAMLAHLRDAMQEFLKVTQKGAAAAAAPVRTVSQHDAEDAALAKHLLSRPGRRTVLSKLCSNHITEAMKPLASALSAVDLSRIQQRLDKDFDAMAVDLCAESKGWSPETAATVVSQASYGNDDRFPIVQWAFEAFEDCIGHFKQGTIVHAFMERTRRLWPGFDKTVKRLVRGTPVPGCTAVLPRAEALEPIEVVRLTADGTEHGRRWWRFRAKELASKLKPWARDFVRRQLLFKADDNASVADIVATTRTRLKKLAMDLVEHIHKKVGEFWHAELRKLKEKAIHCVKRNICRHLRTLLPVAASRPPTPAVVVDAAKVLGAMATMEGHRRYLKGEVEAPPRATGGAGAGAGAGGGDGAAATRATPLQVMTAQELHIALRLRPWHEWRLLDAFARYAFPRRRASLRRIKAIPSRDDSQVLHRLLQQPSTLAAVAAAGERVSINGLDVGMRAPLTGEHGDAISALLQAFMLQADGVPPNQPPAARSTQEAHGKSLLANLLLRLPLTDEGRARFLELYGCSAQEYLRYHSARFTGSHVDCAAPGAALESLVPLLAIFAAVSKATIAVLVPDTDDDGASGMATRFLITPRAPCQVDGGGGAPALASASASTSSRPSKGVVREDVVTLVLHLGRPAGDGSRKKPYLGLWPHTFLPVFFDKPRHRARTKRRQATGASSSGRRRGTKRAAPDTTDGAADAFLDDARPTKKQQGRKGGK